ncbi:uncharacterized protein LOC135940128 [Cloeon dipterum]|uniref:uncharacterized protein LOC135940128 n=1 Tax=Cloeon dipterum TaxID=197152 RepID=UPI00321FA0BE
MAEQEAQHALAVSRMHQFVKSAERIRQIALKFGLPKSAASEIHTLLDLPDDILFKVLKDLMTTECIKLTREEAEMNVLMDPALRLYLSLGIKVVDLTAYLSFCPIRLKYQYLKQAVLRIVKISPNIEELLSLSKIPNCNRIYDTVVDEELLEALGKLTKLRVLQIDEWCCFEIKDLFKLCDKLPNLQYLRITLPDSYDDFVYDEYEILDDLKRSLSKLREFVFFAKYNGSLRYACMKHLPNLRVIKEFAELFCFSDDDESTEPNTIRPGTSDLRHLFENLNYEISVFKDMHLFYPNINHLEVYTIYFIYFASYFKSYNQKFYS